MFRRGLSLVGFLALALASARAGLICNLTFDPGDISGTTAIDVSGHGNNGQLMRGPTQVPGIIGGALSFDGTDDYVDIPHSASLNLDTPFTVGTWAQVSESGTWFRTLVAKYGYSGITPSWGLGWQNANRLGFYIRDNSNHRTQVQSPVSGLGLDGQWHHFLGVRGNGKVQYYMDGELLAEANDNSGDITNTRPVTIARHHSDNAGNHIAGTFDDVAIWDEPLTPGQVHTLAKDLVPAASLAEFSNPILDSGPVAYWRFDETISGALAADWTGANHTASYRNGPTQGVPHPLWYDPDNLAADLDGSNDFISINSNLSPDDFGGDGNYSVELWFNAAARHQADLLSISAPAGHTVLIELENNGAIRYLHRVPAGNSGGVNIYSSQRYNPNTWHYLVAVKEGSEMKLYLDGILDPVTASAATSIQDMLDVVAGRLNRKDSRRSFDGMLDEIALYDRALSPYEIWYHYTGEMIPEPTTLALMGLGGLALALRRRRRR